MEDSRPAAPDGSLDPLFQPFAIGSVALRNRFVFQPHYTALGTREGMPTERHAAYHEARAAGGVGLIVFESQAIHPTGKMGNRFVHAWDPAVAPAYRMIAERVHRQGAKIFGQLTHGGHTSLQHPPGLMWAPSQMPEPSSFFSTKAMDLADIDATVAGFAAAARNARDGGFDGVEIKVAHDGLLRSFASPFFNRRTDAYGGSFEKRMRLSVEVLEAMKRAAGSDFPVGVRICLNEYTSWGYGLDYGLQMAAHLEATGLVDYFNSDAGSFSSFWMEIPPAAVPQGSFRELNAALKKQSKLPVVAFGRIKPPQLAADLIRSGEADLIGLCRQLISDPDTPNKLRDGQREAVRLCIACNDACVYQVNQGNHVGCVHNPDAGNESRFSVHRMPPAEKPLRVAVVGGGPAGLKVAETAARRGHRVILLERAARLGGQILLASAQPHHAEIRDVVDHLAHEIGRLQVEVRLGVEADEATLRDLAADVVVLATGSEPDLPDRRRGGAPAAPDGIAQRLGRRVEPAIDGLALPSVFSVDEVLGGSLPQGRRVLVVDNNGHWEACGTAEFLLDRGFEVEMVTPAALVGSNLEGANLALFNQRSAKKGMRVTPFTALASIGEGCAVLRDVRTGAETTRSVDAVVPVLPRRSREDLYLGLTGAGTGLRVERVGDCVAPRLVQSTIAEAYHLARSL